MPGGKNGRGEKYARKNRQDEPKKKVYLLPKADGIPKGKEEGAERSEKKNRKRGKDEKVAAY